MLQPERGPEVTPEGRDEGPNPEAAPTESPFFVRIPEIRKQREEEDSIRQTFDGSYKEWAIAIDLDIRGNVSKAKLFNLLSGDIRGYDLTNEGNWRSHGRVMGVGSGLDRTLHITAEYVQAEFKKWKTEHPNQLPISRWTTYRARRMEDPKFPSRFTSPEDWYASHPLTEEEQGRNSQEVSAEKDVPDSSGALEQKSRVERMFLKSPPL